MFTLSTYERPRNVAIMEHWDFPTQVPPPRIYSVHVPEIRFNRLASDSGVSSEHGLFHSQHGPYVSVHAYASDVCPFLNQSNYSWD